MKNFINKTYLISASLVTLIFSIIFIILRTPSTIPLSFIYRELGNILGYFPELILVGLLAIVFIILARFLTQFLNLTKTTTQEFLVLIKKRKTIKISLLSFTIAILVILLFSFSFISIIEQKSKKLDSFIIENSDLSLNDYVIQISIFLNQNINNSYNKSEAHFEIDNRIYSNPLDAYIANSFGVTRADIIFYQGWGACEQAAFLIEELLLSAGYSTRQAHFVGWDHAWAEVNKNGKWFIIDPWYIGNMVEITNLRELKPEFQNPSSVEVKFRNGTIVDLGKDYGY